MSSITYNGVSVMLPREEPVFTHSVPLMIASLGRLEANQNIPYFEKMLQYKQTDLPEGELLHEVGALYSIKELNYQVNNGGFRQYFYNGCHLYYAGQEIGDIARLDITQQINFLEKLINFILLFDCFKQFAEELNKALELLKTQKSNIFEYLCSCDEDNYLMGCDAFDEQWQNIYTVIEWGMELYAQYLVKRLEELNVYPSN